MQVVGKLYNALAEDLDWVTCESAVLRLSTYLFRPSCELWNGTDLLFIELARLNDLATAIWVDSSSFLAMVGKIRSFIKDLG